MLYQYSGSLIGAVGHWWQLQDNDLGPVAVRSCQPRPRSLASCPGIWGTFEHFEAGKGDKCHVGIHLGSLQPQSVSPGGLSYHHILLGESSDQSSMNFRYLKDPRIPSHPLVEPTAPTLRKACRDYCPRPPHWSPENSWTTTLVVGWQAEEVIFGWAMWRGGWGGYQR